MKLSIVIPALNSARTLSSCLDSIFKNTLLADEVLVCDCGSTDMTKDIARRYNVRFVELRNAGKGRARNEGFGLSRGEIVFFIDADIMIPKDAIEKAMDIFKKAQEIDAVNGIIADATPETGFFSRYKCIYMNYRFKRIPERIDFLFTSFAALRRQAFVPFEDEIKPKDTKAGQIAAKVGQRNIFLNREIEVTHLRRYTFASLIKNDFSIASDWAKFFREFHGLNDIIRKRRFAHSTVDQIASVLIAPCLLLCLLGGMYGLPFCRSLAALLVLIFLSLNSGFFSALFRKEGFWFSIRAALFTYLDCLAYFFGIICGFTVYLFGQIHDADHIKEVKVIAFDMGNVLLHYNPWKVVFNLAKVSNKPALYIAAYFFFTRNWNKFDEGKYSKDGFYSMLKADLGLKISQAGFEDAFAGMFRENRKITGVLPVLKERFRLILVTNINHIQYDYCLNKFAFFDNFDKKILSYQERENKPSQEIFKRLLKEAAVLPKEILFIDDKVSNVYAAKRSGFQTLLFRSEKSLLKRIAKLLARG